MVQRVRAPMDPTGELLSDKHWPLPELYYYPPEKFVAIHRGRLAYLGTGEAGTLWNAVKRVATPDQLVFGSVEGIYAERVYDCFTKVQLEQLWLNTMKVEYTGENILQACLELGRKIKPIETPVHLLAYDPENPPTYPSNNPISTPISSPTKGRNIQGTTHVPTTYEKPPQGTKTGQVWDVADDLAKKYPGMNKKQLKDEVTKACVKVGINPSTAQVQFGKWLGSRKDLTV
jgi:hypothetical protein